MGMQLGKVWVVFLGVSRVEKSVTWGRDADGCVLRGVGVRGLHVKAEFLVLIVVELDVAGAKAA